MENKTGIKDSRVIQSERGPSTRNLVGLRPNYVHVGFYKLFKNVREILELSTNFATPDVSG
jgi:hypothetical protein